METGTLHKLAEFANGIDAASAPNSVQRRLDNTLLDSFGVALAGARTSEIQAIFSSWPLEHGPAAVWGTHTTTDVATATLLNGISLCVLELDEGNKYARGHPGAHVLPVALAEAQRIGASGSQFLSAFLSGYEVASRIARAFQPTEGLHPHGNWGALGATVAVGRLGGFSVDQLAQAMDAAAALPLASPFASALNGSFVRNTWVGSAGVNGLTSARLVQAGLGSHHENGLATFNGILGRIDTEELLRDLGERWEIEGSYMKRHSSCNYTHPPADAAIEIARHAGFDTNDVTAIEVATHALAAPLTNAFPDSRLSAMFSIPHVVAVALTHGACGPEHFAPDSLQDERIARLRPLVDVQLDRHIDALRPSQRGARVTVRSQHGDPLSVFVPNPIGDADYHPLGRSEIRSKISLLLDSGVVSGIEHEVAQLRHSDCLDQLLALLTQPQPPSDERTP